MTESDVTVKPLGLIQSVKVQTLDDQHEECEAALNRLVATPTTANLKAVLRVYADHFRTEEGLLDQHMYAAVLGVATDGGAGFNADAYARKSHYADHARMVEALQTQAAALEAAAGRTAAVAVPAPFVDTVLREFEQHANVYDASYTERLSAALGPEEAD